MGSGKDGRGEFGNVFRINFNPSSHLPCESRLGPLRKMNAGRPLPEKFFLFLKCFRHNINVIHWCAHLASRATALLGVVKQFLLFTHQMKSID